MAERDERFPVDFDFERYLAEREGKVRARGPIEVGSPDPADEGYVRDRLLSQAPGVLREPHGAFAHPYIVPGAVYESLWDWDAYFAGAGLAEVYPGHVRGCIESFLQRIRDDGRPAKLVLPSGEVQYGEGALPLQAQWAVLACRALGDYGWLRPYWPALVACRRWYEGRLRGRRGLFHVAGHAGYGLDNNPAVYGRSPRSCAPIDVNCFHYREYLAMAGIARELGEGEAADGYEREARRLCEAVNRYMWDPIDGMYYSIDVPSADARVSRQGVTWEVPIKVRNASCLWPLWAGLATQQRAAAVRDHVMSADEFLSAAGVRSHAACEPTYNNEPMGSPSNWQGPVWGLTTFLTAYGLARYGFTADALEVAGRLVSVFASDLRANSCIHECYHGDTGQPVIKPNFLSWNLLAVRVLADIRDGSDPFALD